MESGELPLKQRIAAAMVEADRKTAHLHPGSEERARLWMRVFHESLWGTTPDSGSTSQTERT